MHAGPWARRGRPESPVNFGTIAAFLAWFGGDRLSAHPLFERLVLLALGIARLSGSGRRGRVFWFLFKVLLADDKALDPADYDMVGVLGSVRARCARAAPER